MNTATHDASAADRDRVVSVPRHGADVAIGMGAMTGGEGAADG